MEDIENQSFLASSNIFKNVNHLRKIKVFAKESIWWGVLNLSLYGLILRNLSLQACSLLSHSLPFYFFSGEPVNVQTSRVASKPQEPVNVETIKLN